MVRVLALVEGPTERSFGQRVLAPHLGALGVEFHPRVIGKPGRKGGVRAWDTAKREIVGLIRQEPGSIVTTMIDLYGLPATWPGRQEARQKSLKNESAVDLIEQRLAEAIREEFKESAIVPQFIPYLSQHEFEALLFSDPIALAGVTQDVEHATHFRSIIAECGSCEKIDDDPESAPSKRILKIASGYDKTVDGIAAAERIGLTAIRQNCPHFHSWLDRLESSGQIARL